MKHIPLGSYDRSGTKVQALIAIVDDEDHERVAAHSWHAVRDRNGRIKRAESYLIHPDTGRRETWTMHRFVMRIPRRATPEYPEIDHMDGNPLNNQKANLRPATKAQNAQNRHRYHGEQPPRRVYKNGDRWLASATVDGKTYNLGRYDTEDEAAGVVRNFRATYVPFSYEALHHTPTARDPQEIEAEITATADQMWRDWTSLYRLRRHIKHLRRELTAHGRYLAVTTPPMRVPVHDKPENC